MTDDETDLVIAGAGPVGLAAGVFAHEAGLRFRIVERASEPSHRTRAIGIHPPALRLFDRVRNADDRAASTRTLASTLVDAGIRISRGSGWAGPGVKLGDLDFGRLPPPFSFVLTLPQWRTEAILEGWIEAHAPGSIERSARVTGVADDARSVDSANHGLTISYVHDAAGDAPRTIRARRLLACDGKRSGIRDGLGIPFRGGPYPHRYLMGDLADDSGNHEALIHLARGGLVESFPVELGVRRWVVQRGARSDAGGGAGAGDDAGDDLPRELIDTVANRTGIRLDLGAIRSISPFVAEHHLADTVWKDRVILVGDAAHVVSPIGGQGMNLGWMHAAAVVEAIAAIERGGAAAGALRRSHDRAVRARARRAIRRAEMNMWLAHGAPGRAASTHRLRTGIIRALLHSPLNLWLARRFTMHGL